MKRLIEIIPLITGLLIWFSLIHQIGHYNVIGIYIIYYLDLSEVILLFVPKLFNVSLITEIVVLMLFMIFFFIPPEQLSDSYNKHKRMLNNLKFILFFVGLLLWAFYSFAITRSELDLVKYFDYKITKSYVNILLNVLLYSIFFPLVAKYASLKPVFYLMILASFSYILYTDSYNKSAKMLITGQLKEVSFTHNSEYIHTSKDTVYFGETKSYLFLYDKRKGVATAYDKSHIDLINYFDEPIWPPKRSLSENSDADTSDTRPGHAELD